MLRHEDHEDSTADGLEIVCLIVTATSALVGLVVMALAAYFGLFFWLPSLIDIFWRTIS